MHRNQEFRLRPSRQFRQGAGSEVGIRYLPVGMAAFRHQKVTPLQKIPQPRVGPRVPGITHDALGALHPEGQGVLGVPGPPGSKKEEPYG